MSASRNSSVSAAGFAERHRPVEARAPAGVAGARAQLLDLEPERVLVAIDAQLDDALDVAGAFALLPQRLARAAEIPGLAGLDRSWQRLGVHVRDHQHVAGCGVGDHRGDQAVGVELRREGRAFFDVGVSCSWRVTISTALILRSRPTVGVSRIERRFAASLSRRALQTLLADRRYAGN